MKLPREWILAALSFALVGMLAAAGCAGGDSPAGDGSDGGGTNVFVPTCPAPQQSCNDLCVDTTKDPENCGGCGTTCATTQACVLGTCGGSCLSGRTQCGQMCVDTNTDTANCGACAAACGAGDVCSGGHCGNACNGGQTLCGVDAGAPFCADTQSDDANCGSCGNVCAQGQACMGGSCVQSCPSGETNCAPDAGPAACKDLQIDNANCGTCGNACPDVHVCMAGTCVVGCSTGTTLCTPDAGADAGAPYCADTQNDDNNCGSCGNVCTTAHICKSGACVPGCTGSLTLCSGACIDVQTDNTNCGACGVNCLGGACVAGQCQAVLLASSGNATRLALAGTSIYFTDSAAGTVMSVPLAGGGASTVVGGLHSPNGIITDGSNVYVTESTSTGRVLKCAQTGCNNTPTVIASGQNVPYGLSLGFLSVYWANVGSGTIASCSILSGSECGTLANVLETAQSAYFAVADFQRSALYWGNNSSNAIMTAPLAGGTPTTFTQTGSPPTDVVPYATDLYWTETAGVGTIPFAGGTASLLAASPTPAVDLAVYGTKVYWTESGTAPNYTDGAVMSVLRTGGTATKIATATRPAGILVTPTTLFWTSSLNGGVYALRL